MIEYHISLLEILQLAKQMLDHWKVPNSSFSHFTWFRPERLKILNKLLNIAWNQALKGSKASQDTSSWESILKIEVQSSSFHKRRVKNDQSQSHLKMSSWNLSNFPNISSNHMFPLNWDDLNLTKDSPCSRRALKCQEGTELKSQSHWSAILSQIFRSS